MSNKEVKAHLLKCLQILHNIQSVPGHMCIPISELQIRLLKCYQELFPKDSGTAAGLEKVQTHVVNLRSEEK